MNHPKYGVPVKKGDKYYYSANSGLQDQSVYYSVDSLDSESPKLFLDSNQLSADGTASLQSLTFSPDGRYCAYGISEGGSDWISIKIKDTETLEDLPETLTKVKFSSATWTKDNLGFFYGVNPVIIYIQLLCRLTFVYSNSMNIRAQPAVLILKCRRIRNCFTTELIAVNRMTFK